MIVKLARILAIIGLLVLSAYALPHETISVDESFNDREVALRVGEELKVSLPETRGTGYSWSVPPELKSELAPILRERRETVDAPKGPPGSPGVRHLYFEAIGVGTASLEIDYRRPWEKDQAPARTFKLHVVVRPASGQ